MDKLLPRKVFTLLLPLALGVLALTACNPDQVGAAAIVGGKPITVDELQQATQEFLKTAPSAGAQAQARILDSMIRSRVIDRAADTAQVSASAAEIAQVRDRALTDFGSRTKLVRALAQGENPQVIPPTHIERVARDVVLQNKLVARVAGDRDPNTEEVGRDFNKALNEASRSLHIEVNPRYGTWNARELALASGVGGGLSKSLAELTEAPARP